MSNEIRTTAAFDITRGLISQNIRLAGVKADQTTEGLAGGLLESPTTAGAGDAVPIGDIPTTSNSMALFRATGNSAGSVGLHDSVAGNSAPVIMEPGDWVIGRVDARWMADLRVVSTTGTAQLLYFLLEE